MEFARPGDPLIEKTGNIIEAEGRREPDYSLQVPIAKKLVPTKVRAVKELSADPQTQTVLNAILVYKLLGVGNAEIAYHLNADIREVDKVVNTPAYQDTFEMLFNEIISANSNSLQARIQSFAGKALNNIMDLADSKPVKKTIIDDDDNRLEVEHYSVPPIVILKANDSILDRAGMNADNLYGKNSEGDNSQLEIVVSAASDQKTDVKIKVGR